MSARTDLCGGYQATGIPTATWASEPTTAIRRLRLRVECSLQRKLGTNQVPYLRVRNLHQRGAHGVGRDFNRRRSTVPSRRSRSSELRSGLLA